MKKNILLIILSIFTWINLHASSMSNDSTKLESIQKEIVECMSLLNSRTDYNSNSYLRKTIKAAKRLNELANKYFAITNDSSVFICSFMGEVLTANVYKSHQQIDSAYVHSQRAFQLYEPYGRMICSTDPTKRWSIMVFGNEGICSIMRGWNVKQKNYEEAIKIGNIITDSCRVLKADMEVVKALLEQSEIYEQTGNYKKSLECQTEALERRISYSNFGESPFASQIYTGLFELIGRLAKKEKLLVNKASVEWGYSDTNILSFLNDFIQSHPLDFCEEEVKNGKLFWANQLFFTLIQLSEKYGQYNTIMSIEKGYSDFIIRNYGKESTEYAGYLMKFSNLYNNYLNELDSDVEKEKYRNLAVEKEIQALEIFNTYFKQNLIDILISKYNEIKTEFALPNHKNQETLEEMMSLSKKIYSYRLYMTSLNAFLLKKGNYDKAYDAISEVVRIEERVPQMNNNQYSYKMLGITSIMKGDCINAEEYLKKSYSFSSILS